MNRSLVLFTIVIVASVNALLFGGGGSCGCSSCCPPPPPPCACAPPPPSPCACAPPPPPPCACPAPPPPPPCECAPPPPPPPPPSCSCPQPQPCQPQYQQPQSSYVQPQSSYVQPQSSYVQPQSSYVQPQSSYVQPQQSYQQGPSCQPRYIIVRPVEQVSQGPVQAPVNIAPQGYQAGPAPEQLAPPAPPQIPESSGNYKTDGATATNSKARASKSVIVDSRCNSNELHQLLRDNIVVGDANESKKRVYKAANEEFTTEADNDNGIDVICAPGPFSYRIATDFFCEYTKQDITCFAYQQHA